MRKFTDKTGQEWGIEIGMATALDLKKASDGQVDFVGQDMRSVSDSLMTMASDIGLTVNTIFFLVRDEAEKRGVTETQFGNLLDMDAVERAQRAMQEALIDFFPNRSHAVMHRAAEIADDEIGKRMDEMHLASETLVENPAFEELVRSAIRGGLSGNLQDQLELVRQNSSAETQNSP